MHKPASRRGRRPATSLAHPVAAAVAVARMRNHMRTVGIELFMTDDAQPAAGLVSHLAWIIGMGAEISAQTAPGSEAARRQHMVLRNLVHMATEGCTWRAALAEPIWAAALEAHDLLTKHPSRGLAIVASADFLAERVKSGQIRMSDIAGAEIYQGAAH